MIEIKDIAVTTQAGKSRLSANIAIDGGGILFGSRSMRSMANTSAPNAPTPLCWGYCTTPCKGDMTS